MNGDLPSWAIAVISLIGSTIVTTLVGLIIKQSFKKYLDKKEELDSESRRKDAELKMFHDEEKRQQHRADIAEGVTTAIKPLDERLNRIAETLSSDKAATGTNIRATLKSLRDKYVAQGFADVGDKATWEELYNNYRSMGGNHFKEYVDSWRTDVKNLPKHTSEPEEKD